MSTGLTRCASKPACFAALAVVLLAVAGQRDQPARPAGRAARAAARPARSRPSPAGRCRARRRRAAKPSASASAAGRIVRHAHLVPERAQRSPPAARRRPRCRRRRRTRRASPRGRRRLPSAPRAAVRAARRSSRGSRMTNSLPLPEPVAGRASTVPPCSVDQAAARASGRGRGRPAARSASCALPARTRSKMRGSIVRRDADAVVAYADHDARRRRCARASSAMRPPGVGVLGGVGQQVGDHLRQAHRVAVDQSRPCRHVDGEPMAALLDQRAGHLDRLGARPRPARPARSCSSILPRVIRETSSRSSTRRTRCVDLALDDARSFSRCPGRRAAASAAARSRSATADCAARGRAWPGTRPWRGWPLSSSAQQRLALGVRALEHAARRRPAR